MHTVHLQIAPPYQSWLNADRLIAVARSALRAAASPAAELTIVLTTDEAVRELNRRYRSAVIPTDVLSFEAVPGDFPVPGAETPYLGDVVIAAPTAARQARAAGHTPAEEIFLLTIHGILHLLGYDHHTPVGKAAMWQKQAEILTANGLNHVKPTEETHE